MSEDQLIHECLTVPGCCCCMPLLDKHLMDSCRYVCKNASPSCQRVVFVPPLSPLNPPLGLRPRWRVKFYQTCKWWDDKMLLLTYARHLAIIMVDWTSLTLLMSSWCLLMYPGLLTACFSALSLSLSSFSKPGQLLRCCMPSICTPYVRRLVAW